MKSTEVKNNVQHLIENFSEEEFIYDLLVAYGISKTSVTRPKKGDYNLSKVEGEILYKKKIFFKVDASDKLLSSIEDISKDGRILKHQPRFAILTDYNQLIAKDLTAKNNGKHKHSQILADLQQRDLRDSQRSAAPLVQTTDALLLDTTNRNISEAVEFVLSAYQTILKKMQ